MRRSRTETDLPASAPEEALSLSDLLDLSVLQQMLDWFTQTTGMSAVVRDLDGQPLTRLDTANDFCALVNSSPRGREGCEHSGRDAVRRAIRTGQVVQHACRAGLRRFAAPISVAGRCVGAIVIGEWVEGPVSPQRLARLARDLGLDADDLRRRSERVQRWSGEEKRSPVLYLQSIANAIAGLCYQGYQTRERLRELSRLYDISRLLVSTLDLTHLLGLIARHAADLLGAKGCSIRLLDKKTDELVIKSWYNLSQRYRNKGPVHLERSAIDQAALRGELVEIPDMAHDQRVLYPREAAEEGIAAGAVVGLISKDKPVGTLHIYASEKRRFSEREKQILRSLAAIAAIAIENAQLYAASLELAEVDRELRVAADIQKQLLPGSPPAIPGYQVAAVAVPSRPIGGDFFDFIDLGRDEWALAIADVVGKGIPGAILMATARAFFRAHAAPGRSPVEVIDRTNKLLCQDVKSEQFVTAVYAVLDTRTGTLTSCNAGHAPPLLFRDDRVIELGKGGLVLGGLAEETYEQERLVIVPGDVLVFYTDGFTEAENKRGRFFGRGRLERAVRRCRERSANHILRSVRDSLRAFTLGTPQSDDLTAFVLRCEG